MLRRNRLPSYSLGVWLQLLPLLVMFVLLWVTAWVPFNLSATTVKFWEYLVYGWMYSASVYLLGLVIFTKYLRAWWLAAAFAWIYLIIYAVNASFVYQSGMMVQPYYAWAIRPTTGIAYFLDYVTQWIIVLMVFMLASGVLAAWLIRKYAPLLAAVRARWLILLTFLLWVAPILRDLGYFKPTAVVTQIAHAPLQQGIWRLDQTYSLRALSMNPLIILERVVYSHRLEPLTLRPMSDLAAMSDAVKAWHLSLGPRNYPPLGLKPFKHIIMFGTESLSLDFLSTYNTNLPPDLTPFYASLSNRMFLNYQGVAAPTQPGLAATFNSHPNIGGLLTGGYETSLLKYLDALGYDTYFLMSGPETFLGDNIVFERMGFRHVIGSQTWIKDPNLAPYIQDRGLMDQMLYDKVLDYMAANRDKKIFIQIMNCDTHGPGMRTYYGALPYPPLPASLDAIADTGARAMLAAFSRNDYDVGQTIKKMRERNLLTEDTLVIITADHNCPYNSALKHVPGYPDTPYARLPLTFLSGQQLPPTDDLRQVHSQLDFAPTLMHLLGQPIPVGWWGDSVFATNNNAPAVSKYRRFLTITPVDGSAEQTVSMDYPGNATEKDLVILFNSVFTNMSPLNANSASGLRANSP